MKTLEEKKLLVKMARAFNQPIDPALLESIEQEERFAKLLFKEEVVPIVEKTITEQPKQMIVEADPVPPAFVPPTVVDVVQQTVNVLNTANANTGSDSIVEYNLTATSVNVGNTVHEAGYITTTNQASGTTGQINVPFKYQLERNSFTSNTTEFIIAVTTTTNNPNVCCSINWEEVT